MDRFEEVFTKLAFVLLAVWVVLAGLGMTTMPGVKKQRMQKSAARRHQKASGVIWAVPVTQAPEAEDSLAFPAAPVM